MANGVYDDGFQVWELLDKWNQMGPPITAEVRDLFRRKPRTSKFVGLHGKTFLHRCVEHYGFQDLTLLDCLINGNPAALAHEDDGGLLPLHIALAAPEHNNMAEVIRRMMDASSPEVLTLQDPRTGGLPLHMACQSQYTRIPEVLRILVEAYPSALVHPDNEGMCPLHHAMREETPKADGRLRSRGRGRRQSPESVAYLIGKCPEVLKETIPDEDGYLPLHRAVMSPEVSPRLVEVLIDAFPRALRIQSCIQRQTPLHAACLNEEVTLSTVYSLIRKWPEQVLPTWSTVIFDSSRCNGEMLLSSVASKSASAEMVEQWAHCYSQQDFLEADSHGRLPLHYAAVSRSHEAFDIVKRIAELAPQSLDHADARGRLPLHYAALSPLLPRSNPDGYMVVDDDDDDDPNEIALRTLRYLIRAYPPGVMRKDDDLCVPWHYAQFADSRRGELLLDSTIEADPGLDHYLVPDGEVRWDIVQICHMNSY